MLYDHENIPKTMIDKKTDYGIIQLGKRLLKIVLQKYGMKEE